jgi:hypothetical protein
MNDSPSSSLQEEPLLLRTPPYFLLPPPGPLLSQPQAQQVVHVNTILMELRNIRFEIASSQSINKKQLIDMYEDVCGMMDIANKAFKDHVGNNQ